jgi:LysM repeat protein
MGRRTYEQNVLDHGVGAYFRRVDGPSGDYWTKVQLPAFGLVLDYILSTLLWGVLNGDQDEKRSRCNKFVGVTTARQLNINRKEKIMGLFDFVKEIGNKLFNREEDAAEKIKKHIEESNPGIEGLAVNYKDGVVSISGEATSAEAMEKAVLMAGNVQGVSEVKVDGLHAPPAQSKVEYYIIKKGDTLSAIAKQFYGKANEYPKIFEANREVIKDPDKIFPGQKIRIPLG